MTSLALARVRASTHWSKEKERDKSWRTKGWYAVGAESELKLGFLHSIAIKTPNLMEMGIGKSWSLEGNRRLQEPCETKWSWPCCAECAEAQDGVLKMSRKANSKTSRLVWKWSQSGSGGSPSLITKVLGAMWNWMELIMLCRVSKGTGWHIKSE